MRTRLQRFARLIAVAMVGGALLSTTIPAPAAEPWPDGETLVLSINWGMIHAAQGTFTAVEKPERWEFRLNLISQGTVDTFYPINDWFWSYQQKSPWRSVEYGEDRSEGKRRVRERTRMDYEGKLGVREKWTKAEDDRIPITLEPLDDIGSMLYTLRRGEWKVGDKRPLNIVESSQIKTGEATCVSIEKRTFAPWPEREMIQIHCVPVGATALKEKGALTIWLTNDARRLPLHATLLFKYGTFDIDLVSAVPPLK